MLYERGGLTLQELGKYIVSVTAAAIVVAILQSLFDKKGATSALLRLIGGLFLCFTVISPVVTMGFDTLLDMPQDYAQQGSVAAFEGEQIARDQLRGIITERLRTYILDKATTYGLQIDAEVELSQDEIPVPVAVRLWGEASPYAKQAMQQWLEQELGIRKENQTWIG